MLITIAIPCYKSSKTLPRVVDEIKTAFGKRDDYEYQIILVNDGSPDEGATLQVIRELCAEDSRIIGIELGKNHGQSAARLAAFQYAEGDILVNMDDDGQHSAEDLFLLVDAVLNGADAAYAYFQGKKHSAFKRLASWLNGLIMSAAVNKPQSLHTSSFVAFSKYVIEQMKNYHSPYISFIGYILQHTDRVVNVPMAHRERLEGHSGYTLRKMFGLLWEGLLGFSIFPLHIIRALCSTSLLISLVLYVIAIVRGIRHLDCSIILIIATVFLVTSLIQLGQTLIAGYIGRSYMIQNKLAPYSIREIINCDSNKRD